MIVRLNALGLMLLQEVGFDVVSFWNHMGLMAKGVVLIAALMSACFVGVIISMIVRRER